MWHHRTLRSVFRISSKSDTLDGSQTWNDTSLHISCNFTFLRRISICYCRSRRWASCRSYNYVDGCWHKLIRCHKAMARIASKVTEIPRRRFSGEINIFDLTAKVSFAEKEKEDAQQVSAFCIITEKSLLQFREALTPFYIYDSISGENSIILFALRRYKIT